MKRYYFPLLLAVSLSVDAQPLETFTLEDVLSSPFPADLVAAADEGAFAWTQNDRGRRSLWVARSPGYRAGAIFRDEKDEGQELTQVRFGPRATHVVFVRGGAPNRTGEIPNPASDPGGAAQAVWIARADGSGKPLRIGEGEDPRISPDGKTVAFVKAGKSGPLPPKERARRKSSRRLAGARALSAGRPRGRGSRS